MNVMRSGALLATATAWALASCSGASPDVQTERADTTRGAAPDARGNAAPAAQTDTTPVRVVVHEVNTGPHGMAATVRWLLSPDGRAIIVVEDPVSVEAEPVPDGFVYASEVTGAVVQMNGVWDVTPSPDWSRLAFGRAFVFRSGESETIPEREWDRLFMWLPEDVAEPTTARMRAVAERYTFPASGMSYARAIGLAQVYDVSRLERGRVAVVEAPTVRLEGWRVRWTPSGDTLAVGSAPRTVQDDSDATRWTLVRPAGAPSYRDSLGVMSDPARLVVPRWTTGPTIDVSIEIDMASERRVEAGGAVVRSAGGRIRVERDGRTIDVGPGAALAATHDARFIGAVVPIPDAGEFDHKVRVVVYELSR